MTTDNFLIGAEIWGPESGLCSDDLGVCTVPQYVISYLEMFRIKSLGRTYETLVFKVST